MPHERTPKEEVIFRGIRNFFILLLVTFFVCLLVYIIWGGILVSLLQ